MVGWGNARVTVRKTSDRELFLRVHRVGGFDELRCSVFFWKRGGVDAANEIDDIPRVCLGGDAGYPLEYTLEYLFGISVESPLEYPLNIPGTSVRTM